MTADEALAELAEDIAREAGALAARRRAEGVRIAATKSALADIVTEADREVEDLIRRRLAVERPEDGFLGEESGAAAGDADVTWVVDPIDGTVNYAYGLAEYAVSVAAVTGPADPASWVARAAVVHAPASGETFRAARGSGAFLGHQRLSVNTDVPEAGALLATGFGYDPATHGPALERLARVMPLARDIRRIGAASLDLAFVAAGRLDGYYERGLQPWDHAAGALLVVEAGGVVGGEPGGRPGREMIIAAGPALTARLSAALCG